MPFKGHFTNQVISNLPPFGVTWLIVLLTKARKILKLVPAAFMHVLILILSKLIKFPSSCVYSPRCPPAHTRHQRVPTVPTQECGLVWFGFWRTGMWTGRQISLLFPNHSRLILSGILSQGAWELWATIWWPLESISLDFKPIRDLQDHCIIYRSGSFMRSWVKIRFQWQN